MVNVGHHPGKTLAPLFQEQVAGDDIAVARTVGGNESKAALAAGVTGIGLGQTGLPQRLASRGRLIHQLPQRQPVRRQIHQQVARDDDRLVADYDGAARPVIPGGSQRQVLNLSGDRCSGCGARWRGWRCCREKRKRGQQPSSVLCELMNA